MNLTFKAIRRLRVRAFRPSVSVAIFKFPVPVLCAVALSGALMSISSAAQADAAAGEQKAYTCLGCHGVLHYVNTYPTYHVPRLGGQHKDYLVAALKAYRSKQRAHPTMQANANLLTDEDINDIAEYFAGQGKK